MRRLFARDVLYRAVAVLCFAFGVGLHHWVVDNERGWFAPPGSGSQILVHALRMPASTLLEARHLTSGYEYGGRITTCGWQFTDMGDPNRTAAQQEKECMLKKEQARKFLLKNWRERRTSYLEIDVPCADCSPVYDVLIEQNENGGWQVAAFREQSVWDAYESKEEVAVSLKRRRATKEDSYTSKIGESLLLLLDAKGQDVLREWSTWSRELLVVNCELQRNALFT